MGPVWSAQGPAHYFCQDRSNNIFLIGDTNGDSRNDIMCYNKASNNIEILSSQIGGNLFNLHFFNTFSSRLNLIYVYLITPNVN